MQFLVKCPIHLLQIKQKTKVNNPELRGLCQRATTQMLEEFERRHNDEFSKIVELLTKELRAEAAAEKSKKADFRCY